LNLEIDLRTGLRAKNCDFSESPTSMYIPGRKKSLQLRTDGQGPILKVQGTCGNEGLSAVHKRRRRRRLFGIFPFFCAEFDYIESNAPPPKKGNDFRASAQHSRHLICFSLYQTPQLSVSLHKIVTKAIFISVFN
jgi:hypothetical protein